MGIGSVVGMGFGMVTMWKSAIFYGKQANTSDLLCTLLLTLLIHFANCLSVCIVEPGHRAFKFNKFTGVQD